jgi:hypothetical protein
MLLNRTRSSVALQGEALVGASFGQTVQMSWEPGHWVKEGMLQSGQSQSEVLSLMDQCGSSPSISYYLACLDHSFLYAKVIEHQHCGNDFQCNFENLGPETYTTRHSSDCSDRRCPMLTVDRSNTPIVSNLVLGSTIL